MTSTYFWCIVPMCKNTSIKTPEKTFIQVPKNEKRRDLWFNMVRRDPKDFSKTSSVFVCEDHFDLHLVYWCFQLANDMENYLKWRMMGGPKFMKHDIVPHKFDCQKNGKLTFSKDIVCKDVEKRRSLQEIQEAFNCPSASEMSDKKNVGVANCKVFAEHLSEESQAEPKKKDAAISVKPCYRSIDTQTI